jgi:hypothetical protein
LAYGSDTITFDGNVAALDDGVVAIDSDNQSLCDD